MATAVVGVMGPVSLGVAVGCLQALGWILGFAALLMALLFIKDSVSGSGAAPGLFIAAPLFVLAGWGCWQAAKWLKANGAGH